VQSRTAPVICVKKVTHLSHAKCDFLNNLLKMDLGVIIHLAVSIIHSTTVLLYFSLTGLGQKSSGTGFSFSVVAVTYYRGQIVLENVQEHEIVIL